MSCAAFAALAMVQAAAATGDGAAACPRQPRAVFERFISADCDVCWTSTDTPAAPGDAWLLDWIVPSERGDDAPLSAAAPREAKERAVRGKGALPPPRATVVLHAPIAPRGPSRLTVASGPAWNGYFGVQFSSRGRWPRGSTAWMALVETVPRGTDGTPVPRQLVRSVAGPIALDAVARSHNQTHAMRWPETAKPERLRAAAWIETPSGRIIAFAHGECNVTHSAR